MIDIHTRKLVDMIESREAAEVIPWLKTYPNIAIVSRDGSRAYATAIKETHPKAIQISDRFHLIKNLTDAATLALQKIFQGRVPIPVTEGTQDYRMMMLIGTVAQQVQMIKELRGRGHSQNEISLITGASIQKVRKYLSMKEIEIPKEKQTTRGREHQEAIQKLQQRVELVHQLREEGLSLTRISQRTGFVRNTVENYLSDNFSSINAHYGKQREGKLAPFREEVLKLRSKGYKYCKIHELLKEKGYSGTQDAIRGFVSKERRIQRDLIAKMGGAMEWIDKKWLIRLLYQPIERVKGITRKQLEAVQSAYPCYQKI